MAAQSRYSLTVRPLPPSSPRDALRLTYAPPRVRPTADISPDALAALRTTLEAAGFAPYVTAVGGSGVGILHPDDRTSSASSDLAREILSTGVDELDGWALAKGRWGFA